MQSGLPVFAFGLLTVSFGAIPALSATQVASFNVAVTVQASCVAAASSMSIGTYTAAGTNIASRVSVTCTNSAPYIVRTIEERVPDPMAATRMTAQSWTLPGHALVANGPRTFNWGVTGLADTIHKEISMQRHVATAAFPDSITISITY
jgi:spore coat protein U-like protein